MPRHRAVMDTNVLYAGLRSRHGASHEVLEALWQRRWTLVLSQTTVTEYEEILKRESTTLRLSLPQINRLLDALCAAGGTTPHLRHLDSRASRSR